MRRRSAASGGDGHRLANAYATCAARDRVATLIENSPEAMLAWWGAVRGGGVAVPINTAYKGDYLVHQLTDCGARVVVVEESLAERVARVADRVPELEHVVVVGDTGAVDGVQAKVHAWDGLLQADERRPAIESRPSDLATFITGGTTGLPKGCMSATNHVALTDRSASAGGARRRRGRRCCRCSFNAPVTALARQSRGRATLPAVLGVQFCLR